MRVIEVDYGEPHTLVVVDRPFAAWLIGHIGDWLLSRPPFSRTRLGHRLVVWSDAKGVDVLHVSVAHGCDVAAQLWPGVQCFHEDPA